MYILVINSGSSSIKYQLFGDDDTVPVCHGLLERIGEADARLIHNTGKDKNVCNSAIVTAPDHRAGMLIICDWLCRPDIGVIKNAGEIAAVGHRVVHGGEHLTQTTLITNEVKNEIKRLFPLAPLHNPGHYQGITVAGQLFPNAAQIAVFDTAFHQTLPHYACRYAIPTHLYQEHGIRVYGFHGISHQYVSRKAAEILGNPGARIVTAHLGNGCSMSAVKAGICIDTSMGLTPLDGLVMGTRCGSIDPSVLLYLIQQLGYTATEVATLLNKESGMLGLTGYNDMRDVRKLLDEGNASAQLAYDMYAYRIRKYIGAYAAAMNGVDALVFTAGVGEHDALLRHMVCNGMDYLGIELDKTANASAQAGICQISAPGSRVRVLVIPTNEELEIANQCRKMLLVVK